MPIEVHAVSKEKFEQWIAVAKDDIDAAQEMNLLTTTATAE
jgi:heme/copper-type cytochrome/quinol oxidase subunit 2